MAELSEAQLAHYAAKPFSGTIRSIPVAEQTVAMKPRGLWISVDGNEDGWRDWCEGEQWGLEGLAHRHLVQLRENTNVLWLRDCEAIDWLDRQYSDCFSGIKSIRYINWRPIAEQYDGIFIAPYQWHRRLDHNCSWYYSWDCASGCIWNADAILSIIIDAEYEGRRALSENDHGQG